MSLIIDGTNGLTFPNSTVQASAGQLLQVVSATYATTVTSTTATLIDTGLTATITPKFTTSKVLVIVSQPIRVATSALATFYLNRAGTNIKQIWSAWGYLSTMSAQMSFSYLDSPATTSATIYKTQFSNTFAAGTVSVSPDGSTDLSTITLMEIAA